MIPDQWYAILESGEVPSGRPVGVRRMGEQLVFWRDQHGGVSCLRDFCPHRGVALSTGRLVDGKLQCPFHGFRFDADGQCCLVPANGRNATQPRQIKAINGRNATQPRQIKAIRYPTYEAHGFIFIWWGEARGELPPPRFFDNLDELSYATARDPWKAHYSRVIENQLDVSHLPFVHYNTIGRGGRTLVDGPLVEWDGPDKFYLYVFNREDDGSPPRRPQDLVRPDGPFWLEFIFPNLWQNHISEQVRVVAAFVPVDEENTLLYLRFYQGFLHIPGLNQLFNLLSLPMNLYIAHQDRRVVETQRPKPSTLKSGEKLIQADRPIIQYRQRRDELKNSGKLTGVQGR